LGGRIESGLVDRRIRRLGIGLVLMFAALFAQLSYVQVFKADSIKANAANARRQIIAEYKVERGLILSSDGTVLAKSEVNPDKRSELKFLRNYPGGALFGQLTGYYSRVFGSSALERAMNPFLSGDAPELAISTFTDLILGRPKEGGTITTTIDADLQAAAAASLGDQPGAVVATDPRTGDILAMVANPSYDPNAISTGTAEEIEASWAALNDDPDKPLVSRAREELYLPGSTGKLITAAAALENGFGPDSEWKNPQFLDLPQTSNTLANFGNSLCNGGSDRVTMAEAFKESCNVTFAEIGLELGAEKMSEQAHRFGFCPTDPPDQVDCIEPTIPFDLPFQEGHFPIPEYFQDNAPLLAFSSIGLDNVITNPMHMALVAGAIGNRGIMMQPRLVTEVRDPQGRVVRTFEPEEYGRPLTSGHAATMREMMLGVTEFGTASSAFSGFPISVAGKTGTATNGENVPPNAWFVCFAPADADGDPRIAVAVIVLDGGTLSDDAATGGAIAAPIARQVIDAYL
jgi:penicillin-binding protein A